MFCFNMLPKIRLTTWLKFAYITIKLLSLMFCFYMVFQLLWWFSFKFTLFTGLPFSEFSVHQMTPLVFIPNYQNFNRLYEQLWFICSEKVFHFMLQVSILGNRFIYDYSLLRELKIYQNEISKIHIHIFTDNFQSR